MLKYFLSAFLMFSSLQAIDLSDFIKYHPSDVFVVKEYKSNVDYVDVLVEDWYEETREWYRCYYHNDWCYPVFYPTLAVRYGEKIKN